MVLETRWDCLTVIYLISTVCWTHCQTIKQWSILTSLTLTLLNINFDFLSLNWHSKWGQIFQYNTIASQKWRPMTSYVCVACPETAKQMNKPTAPQPAHSVTVVWLLAGRPGCTMSLLMFSAWLNSQFWENCLIHNRWCRKEGKNRRVEWGRKRKKKARKEYIYIYISQNKIKGHGLG